MQLIYNFYSRTTRAFSLWLNKHHKSMASYLFVMMDEQDISPLIYQRHDWEQGGEGDEGNSNS